MTLQQLRGFLAVAQELHFARAAKTLNMSTSALSDQIAALERTLGAQLFYRRTRSIEVTSAGLELIPMAQQVAAASGAIEQWASERVGISELRVGVMASSPQFQRIMRAAAQRMPSLRWQIRQLGFLNCRQKLLAGEVDCVFVGSQVPEPRMLIERIELWDEPSMLMVPEGHRLAGGRAVALDQLRGEALICSPNVGDSERWLTALEHAVGGDFRRVDVAHNFEEVLELCRAGLGVNICPRSASVAYARQGVAYLELENAGRVSTSLWMRREEHSQELEHFARIAMEDAGIRGQHP